MTQGRKFSRHRAPVNRVGKQLLEKSRNIVAAGICQCAFAAVEKRRELADVAVIGGNGERAKSLLDFEVIDEIRNDARIGFEGHRLSMRVIGHCEKY